MLSKSSIESGLILALAQYKNSPSSINIPKMGSLLELLVDESSFHCENINFNYLEVMDGDYEQLIDDIYAAVNNTTSTNDDGVKVIENTPHDTIMEDFTSAMANSINNNLEFVREIVLKDLRMLEGYLLEAFNTTYQESKKPKFFDIKPVAIPPIFLEENVRSAIADVEEAIINTNINVATINNKEFISEYTEITNETHLEIITKYLSKLEQNPSLESLRRFDLDDLAIVLEFFVKLSASPNYNTGKSSLDNKDWSDAQIRLIGYLVNPKIRIMEEEISRGQLVSSLTPRINRFILRPIINEEDPVPFIMVYQTSLDQFSSKYSGFHIDDVIGGFLTLGESVDSFNIGDLTEDKINYIMKGYSDLCINHMKTTLNRKQNIVLRKVFCSAIEDFVSNRASISLIEEWRNGLEYILDVWTDRYCKVNSEVTDKEIYELSKTVIVNMMYVGSNASSMVSMLEEFSEDIQNPDELVLAGLNTTINNIYTFLREQYSKHDIWRS